MVIFGRCSLAILYHGYCSVLVGKQEIAAVFEGTGNHEQESAQVDDSRLLALQSGVNGVYQLQQ